MFRLDDTIVAASSPPGRSFRGLVRLTGPGTLAIVEQLTRQPLPPPRQLTATMVYLPITNVGVGVRCAVLPPLPPGESEYSLRSYKGEGVPFLHSGGFKSLPLPVMLAVWHEPASYTGQHSAEIQCPGHPALLERIIHQVIALGARLAGPGEFTFRAYMHGKMDLTQAEGVAAMIAAHGHAELAAAQKLCAGDLGRFGRELAEKLAELLALVEAGIDFTDQDDVTLITPAQALLQLQPLTAKLQELRKQSRSWGQLEALPRVVLVGSPSVGKSTLFNALLGQKRAVTSHTPGTTRDVLMEPLTLRDDVSGRRVEVMLVDVAGIQGSGQVGRVGQTSPRVDPPSGFIDLDAQAQTAARSAIDEADLLLVLHDPTAITDRRTPTMADHWQNKPTLHLLAQCDRLPEPVQGDFLPISALRGDGLDELRQRIIAMVGSRGISLTGNLLALQPRHASALHATHESLQQAIALLEPQVESPVLLEMELLAGHLRLALDALTSLSGNLSPDEVLDRVFAKFCIGK